MATITQLGVGLLCQNSCVLFMSDPFPDWSGSSLIRQLSWLIGTHVVKYFIIPLPVVQLWIPCYGIHAQSPQSCLTVTPCIAAPPGSSVHRILQARLLEWVAMSFSRGSSRPRDRACISYVFLIGRQVLYHWRHLGSHGSTTVAD